MHILTVLPRIYTRHFQNVQHTAHQPPSPMENNPNPFIEVCQQLHDFLTQRGLTKVVPDPNYRAHHHNDKPIPRAGFAMRISTYNVLAGALPYLRACVVRLNDGRVQISVHLLPDPEGGSADTNGVSIHGTLQFIIEQLTSYLSANGNY